MEQKDVRPFINGKKLLRDWIRVKVVVLFILIVIVWGLLTLPIVFYHIPVEVSTLRNSNLNATCPTTLTESSVCENSLVNILSLMNCDTNLGGDILVQQNDESTASQILLGLNIINLSPECRELVVPFLCLYLFGLCDTSGSFIQPTIGQCEEIRDVVCRTEWATALRFGIDLPDCGIFPMESPSCPVLNANESEVLTISLNTSTSELLDCCEDFFREEGSEICVPSCYTWKVYSQTEAITTDVIILSSIIVGFISGLFVLVLSFIRFKRMFVFSSIFVIYMTCDIVVIQFFALVGYFNRSSLYCSSPNLLDSFFEVTPFCVITGIIVSYSLLQLTLWGMFHTTVLLWKIRFPLHARSFEIAHRVKYIHIGCVIAGLILPLVPVITSMVTFAVELESDEIRKSRNITFVSGGMGYGSTQFPPILCSGTNDKAVYYALILPINLILIYNIAVLVFVFYIIHKQYGLIKAKKSKGVFKFGTAERKILIIFCYYILLVVVALTSFTLNTRNSEPFLEALINYFFCEGRGNDPNNPCDRNTFHQYSNPELTTISFVLINIFPVINLVYALNIKEMKEKFKSSVMMIKLKFSNTA